MKESFVRAAAAFGYIFGIASLLQAGPPFEGVPEVYVGVIMISLFTLSAAVMGYLFFWKPVEFFLSGERKKALDTFLGTLGYFVLLVLLLAGTVFATASF